MRRDACVSPILMLMLPMRLTRSDAIFWCAWVMLLAAFAALSVWAHYAYFLPFEQHVLETLERNHDSVPLSERTLGYLSDLGRVPVIVALVVIVAALLVVRRAFVEALAVAGVLPMGVAQIGVRHLIDRPQDPSRIPTLDFQYPYGASFPSGHAFGEFMVFGLLFVFAPLIVPQRAAWITVRIVCVLLVLASGLERVVDGAHWPSDVIGAYMLALLYVSAAAWICTRVRRSSARMLGAGRQQAAVLKT